MDGARFGNALARMNVSPAEATWKAGVDVLSFGATKGGAMAAEAVVFFDPRAAPSWASGASAAGHLLSKHRFLAAQFEGYLARRLLAALARHANAMADLLADGLRAAGAPTGLAGRGQYRVHAPAEGLGCEAEGRQALLITCEATHSPATMSRSGPTRC